MGAHSSLIVTKTEARTIWNEIVEDESQASLMEMEAFFDKVADEALFNVCIREQLEEGQLSEDAKIVRRLVESYLEKNPTKRPDPKIEELRILRELLAVSIAGVANLYTDDGELQDNTVNPSIDFRRDSAVEIRRKLQQRGRDTLDISPLLR